MASYENGAYEALQWAWIILKRCQEDPNAVVEARHEISEKLSDLGKGMKINFHRARED